MTHDTPPKRMVDLISREAALAIIDPGDGDFHAGNYNGIAALPTVTGYTLASEADAMVAAALRDLAQRVALQMEVLSAIHQPWPLRTAGKVDAILALIQAPASAALDKLIAEAVKAERDALEVQYDELYADALADAKSDSQEFEGELWKAIRSILDDLDYDWSGDAQEDGVSADEAAQFIRDALDCNSLRAQLAEAQKREARLAEAVKYHRKLTEQWRYMVSYGRDPGEEADAELEAAHEAVTAALSAAPTGEESNG